MQPAGGIGLPGGPGVTLSTAPYAPSLADISNGPNGGFVSNGFSHGYTAGHGVWRIGRMAGRRIEYR